MKDNEDLDGERQQKSSGGEMSSGNSDNPPQCNSNRNKETDCSSPTCGDKQSMHHEDHYPGLHCFFFQLDPCLHCCTGLFCTHDCWASISLFSLLNMLEDSCSCCCIPTNISLLVDTSETLLLFVCQSVGVLLFNCKLGLIKAI
jgi:hypothetical protein